MRTKKIVLVGIVLSFAALMAFATACKKEPTPNQNSNPNTPNQTHYPDTVYVPWDWNPSPIILPNMDTINFYAKIPEVKKIIMVLEPMSDERKRDLARASPQRFNRVTDSLIVRDNAARGKGEGRGDIYTSNFLPNNIIGGAGMHDSTRYKLEIMGYHVKKFYGH